MVESGNLMAQFERLVKSPKDNAKDAMDIKHGSRFDPEATVGEEERWLLHRLAEVLYNLSHSRLLTDANYKEVVRGHLKDLESFFRANITTLANDSRKVNLTRALWSMAKLNLLDNALQA